ncbi:hypothetical protein GQ55_2G242600 [Panicum hallii var. hallii]|uniref:Glycosyltransferase n=1 Tax=Panicum hallii var. hallii TaxID=1504633 RepID=A0A2T7ERW5_9POAL|nr:hypothetical protein GQ55_2G242600 [Panicum hallii var. hallii]PUZ70574.1 hypothetical protein GQ55_2G242600 [Panicum hallii var. hallii]
MAPPTAAAAHCQDLHGCELPHVAVFPLMAKGHTIPLLDLACLLRRRGLAAVTLLTTPGNAAFARTALADGGAGDAAVIELPFPAGHAPAGGESAEGVACASSFAAFAEATSPLRPRFEYALAAMRPPPGLLVADGFLYWAHASAAALGVPSVSFLGTSAFAHVVREACVRDKPGASAQGDDASTGTYTVPEFPHLRFSLADLVPPPLPLMELDAKMAVAVAASHGVIMNTFHDLEGRYIEHWNRQVGPRAWPIGPLCLARQSTSVDHDAHASRSPWMVWLDEKAAAGRAVLYISLGTLAAIPEVQLRQVADGLDRAGVDFLWAVRPNNAHLGIGFEERVEGRGKVVREWVDQREILGHSCVRGFLSHCGWNSVLESVAAGVPLAAWPTAFEQPMNAKFIVDELGIGVRVHSSDGTIGGLVKSNEIARVVRDLMFGEDGMSMASNAAKLARHAQIAVSEGGSSWKAIEDMIGELCATSMARKSMDG